MAVLAIEEVLSYHFSWVFNILEVFQDFPFHTS